MAAALEIAEKIAHYVEFVPHRSVNVAASFPGHTDCLKLPLAATGINDAMVVIYFAKSVAAEERLLFWCTF